jgi:DNA-binding MltR family transcriptional regulator
MAQKRLPLPPEKLAEDSRHLFDAVNGQSALACVLISVSALEQAVGSILKKHFLDSGPSETLLHDRGALGPLFARANLAYALGLISVTSFQNLLELGEIRNIFAHSHVAIDFDHPKVIGHCQKLKTMFDTMTDQDGKPHWIAEAIEGEWGSRFVLVVTTLHSQLILTALSTERRAACTGNW